MTLDINSVKMSAKIQAEQKLSLPVNPAQNGWLQANWKMKTKVQKWGEATPLNTSVYAAQKSNFCIKTFLKNLKKTTLKEWEQATQKPPTIPGAQ